MVTEVFELRKSLEATGKELSYALYYNDAALRVIARQKKEKEELEKLLMVSRQ